MKPGLFCFDNYDYTEEEYVDYICSLHEDEDYMLTWKEIADIINVNLGYSYDESTYRKKYKQVRKQQNPSSEQSDLINTITEAMNDLKKERMKLADVNTNVNAALRRMSREETLKEIALEVASTMSSKKILKVPEFEDIPEANANDAVLQLSDWHHGMQVNSYFNTYSPEICTQRVTEVLKETIEYVKQFKVKKLHVVNLGDLIAGRIHSTIRLQSRIDVITQTMCVCEMLSEFLNILSKYVYIEYYDCLDNHSRLEPNKKESLDLESLARIIPWFIGYRLQDNTRVNINTNTYTDDIISFEIGKYKIGGVHGDKDKPKKVVENITLLTKQHYDLILAAHLHHFTADEKDDTLVLNNGSLMGADTYALDLRCNSKASQNIFLVTEKSVCDYIHRIILN